MRQTDCRRCLDASVKQGAKCHTDHNAALGTPNQAEDDLTAETSCIPHNTEAQGDMMSQICVQGRNVEERGCFRRKSIAEPEMHGRTIAWNNEPLQH